jgi:hypothetical protein
MRAMRGIAEQKGHFSPIAMRWMFVIAVGCSFLIYSCTNTRQVDDSASQTSTESKKDGSSLEPHNPYEAGTGHYAGFRWGEDGKSCGGNSTSFIEGCEEHEAQEDAYGSCTNQ